MDALATLYYVLAIISKLMAPMVPFFAETAYSVLNLSKLTGLDSVHLDLYPETKKLTPAQQKILTNMSTTRENSSNAHAIRVEMKIPVRQSLNSLATVSELAPFYQDILKDEVNVKKIEFYPDEAKFPKNYVLGKSKLAVALDTEITDELKLEGLAREMIRTFQDLRKGKKLNVEDRINAVYPDTQENKQVLKKHGAGIKQTILAKTMTSGKEYGIEKI